MIIWREISVSYLEPYDEVQQTLVQSKKFPPVHFPDWRRDEDDSQR